MYERIKSLYLAVRLTASGLARAVALGWITEAQLEAIKAEKEATNGS